MGSEKNQTQTRLTGRILVVVLIGVVVFCYRAGSRQLWNPDEPRYARIAGEMIRSGVYLTTQFNNAPYREKPPIYFWLVAGLTRICALDYPNSWTTILPSSISAILCLVVIYLAGLRHYGRRTAMGAVLIASTAGLFLWIGRRAQLDMTLTAACTIALVLLYESFQPGRSLWLAIGAGVAMAAAAMTKFHGYLPLVPAVIYCLWAKGINRRRAAVMLCATSFVGALLSVPWFYWAAKTGRGPDLLYQMHRVSDWRGHGHGPLYFLFVAPLAFLPWTLFAVEGAVRDRKSVKEAFLKRQAGFSSFCWIWALGVVLFFSIPESKRELYVLPMIPALSLLTARGIFGGAGAERTDAHGPSWAGRLTGALICAAGYLLLAAGGVLAGLDAFHWWQLAALGLIAVPAGWILFKASSRGAPGAVKVLFGSALVCALCAWATVIPFLDAKKSALSFCRELVNMCGSSPRVAFYDQYQIGGFLYHLPTVRQVEIIEPTYEFEKNGEKVRLNAGQLRNMTKSELAQLTQKRVVADETYDGLFRFLKNDARTVILKEDKFREFPENVRRRLRIAIARSVSNDVYLALRLKETRSGASP